MNYKKILSILTFLAILAWFCSGNIQVAQAQTAQDLLTQIIALQAQIAQLQQQLAQLQGQQPDQVPAACTGISSFTRNLYQGGSIW